MKKRELLLAGSLLGLLMISVNVTVADTDTEDMNTTLTRINSILSQIYPLINKAEEEQSPNARIQFHFTSLRKDIAYVQAGITSAIKGVSIQPRQVTPLSGDYLSVPNSVVQQQKFSKARKLP